MFASYGDEGTNCYICEACKRPCDPAATVSADELVTLIKTNDKSLRDQLREHDVSDIDFTGCSSNYVREKLNAAAQYLQFLSTQIWRWEREQKKHGKTPETGEAIQA